MNGTKKSLRDYAGIQHPLLQMEILHFYFSGWGVSDFNRRSVVKGERKNFPKNEPENITLSMDEQ